MGSDFADRMGSVHKSFIREILKVTQDPSIISFGGGLPNPSSFPILEISEAAEKVLRASGEDALQYSTTEGYLPLREIIAERYARRGLKVSPHNILITSGSQQGIDLTGKVFINKGDPVLVEKPTYLATLQAYGLYEPEFRSIPLQEDGPDLAALERELAAGVKMFYAVPNFQNPTGITYSLEKRRAVARLLDQYDTVFIEDDPYGEIRYMGEDLPPVKSFLERSVLLGSFSKIVSPGMRLGWLVAPDDIMDKVIVAKQATDLHTNYFIQRVVHRYMADNDVDAHIAKIKALYRKQRDSMVTAIEAHFPAGVQLHEAGRRHVPLGHAARGRVVRGIVRPGHQGEGRLRAGHGLLRGRHRRQHAAAELHELEPGSHRRRHRAAGQRDQAADGGENLCRPVSD